MSYVIRHPVTWVWVLLASATALSWWLGTGQGIDPAQAHLGTTLALMGVAFVKVRLVMSHFMELRHAPWLLRLIRDVWIVAACAAILVLYRFGGVL
jgi:hypothetical protein